ncbi:Peptidoglycan-binding LysM domain-containing protein, putative isoform 2 [Hibiscus syriacus]|uniref:Peptidoglycan-binding LysM domain-containing protein, putative isoform 2 n=1 Tax=Hibiscus syriacus TaxID=106335 RepID=A0A6A2ZHT5_HIBSY|nr:uncharacterized protein LOC120144474 [Hibiscus syriacus]KAE8691448.1 Peptidoglycan-binding LysM domain-containing protein, putative isoform 2 [Hibiscus syriacus]
MERERWNSAIANGHYSYDTNGYCTRFCNDYRLSDGDKVSSPTLPSAGYIEHTVSRFDTLAGVAIKYGVEVSDIRKMNGLVTDLQMFALKTLQIALPGRHPPSPSLSNDSTASGKSSGRQTPRHLPPDWLDSFQSLKLRSPRKVSPAMSSLQGYYGLKATEKGTMSEVLEMALYRKGEADYVDDGLLSHPHLRLKRKSRSVANGFYSENGEILVDIMAAGEDRDSESQRPNDKLIRRPQKSEADFTARLLKEENSNNGGGFSLSKRLTLKSKSGSRMNSGTVADGEMTRFNPATTIEEDEYVIDGFEVRKSSSASCLHDHQDNSCSIGSSSLTSLLLMDLQGLSTAGITRPIFDGFTNMSARKNKAALD